MVLVVKNPSADAGDLRRLFDPWVGKIPWRRTWQPTSVFLPGGSHGRRRLEGNIQSIAWQSQTRLKRPSPHAHPHQNLFTEVQSSFPSNHQEPETTQMGE